MWQCNHCNYKNEDKDLVALHIINNHKDKLARNARRLKKNMPKKMITKPKLKRKKK